MNTENTTNQSNSDRPYTLYWLFDKREIIWGSSIEDAFTRAGYGAGALKAIDFYSEGMCCAYIRENGKWVKRPEFQFTPIDLDGEYFESDRVKLIEKLVSSQFHRATFTYANGNEISLSDHYGWYCDGAVRHWEIQTSERFEGKYHPDATGDHYFMSNGSWHFRPSDRTMAIAAFIEAIRTSLSIREQETYAGAMSIAELQVEQRDELP